MEPTISSIINSQIYGGKLRNGDNTVARPNSAKFKAFLKNMSAVVKTRQPGARDFDADTCSVVVSPTPSLKEFPKFGSEKMQGSSSSYNLQTAAMVLRTVYYLVVLGKFAEEEVIVTSLLRRPALVVEDAAW